MGHLRQIRSPRVSPINIVLVVAFAFWGIICGTLTIFGAIWIDSGEKHKVKKGSILVLVFSILSWIGADAGLLVGFILGLVGAILGLTWKTPVIEKPPAPPKAAITLFEFSTPKTT